MAGKHWENHCESLSSCALSGAAAFFAGIPGAAIVVNGPAWCYFYALRQLDMPELQIEKRFFSTYPDGRSVVFGTEDKLTDALQAIRDLPQHPTVLLIQNSCAISLIGDDIAGIAAGMNLPFPVVTMDSGGITGGHWAGYRKAARTFFTELEQEDVPAEPLTVNLIGSDVSYFSETDDIRELRRLLGLIGVRVQAVVGNGASLAQLQTLRRAVLNIVVHDECGTDLAEYLQETTGLPFIRPGLPYGLNGTRRWLRAVGEALGLPEEAYTTAEAEIRQMDERLYQYTHEAQKMWGEPWFERVVVSAPGSVAGGLAGAMQEEWLDAAEVLAFAQDEQLPGQHGTQSCGNVGPALQAALTGENGLLLGSAYERKWLAENDARGWSYITVAVPDFLTVALRPHPYVGIRGTETMAEEVWRAYLAHCWQAEEQS